MNHAVVVLLYYVICDMNHAIVFESCYSCITVLCNL